MSDDDDVGYRKPPKRTQFKPGRSGNPKGRAKGQRNLKANIESLMSKPVAIREDGKVRQVTRQEALFLSLYANAANGNAKAATDLLKMCASLGDGSPESVPAPTLSQTDLKVIAQFVEYVSAQDDN
jgi:hypothetical protein